MSDLPVLSVASQARAMGGGPVAFTPENKKRVARLVTRYPSKQAALLPALWVAQEQWGWISKEVVDCVAAELELTPAFVWGVVTFYTMYNRAPVGKYLVQFCTSIACHLNGAENVYEHTLRKLGLEPGGTTADGKFTVMEVECLALCDQGPCVQINDKDYYRLTPEALDKLLSELK